jgi:DNA-binding NarL/FixJ family response regulator
MGCELLSSALNSEPQGLRVVGGVVSCKELVETALAQKPDVILISLALQEGPTAGFDALNELRSCLPDAACIIMMDTTISDLTTEALRCGARGVFLRRDGPVNLLRRCIRIVHEGGLWISSGDLVNFVKRVVESRPISFRNAKGDELLTKRERELVLLVAQGLSNREIAKQVNLSEHTVKNYLLRIFDKLGVSSRAELIVYALGRKDTTQ